MTPPQIAAGDWQLDVEPPPDAPPTGTAEPRPPAAVTPVRRPPAAPPAEAPPPVERIVEALLFVGGPPLTAAAVAAAVRGLTSTQVTAAVDALNAAYRAQNRPYTIQPRGDGWVLTARESAKAVRERLHGGPKAARLSQPAVDVLGLVAYRQPVAKADLDAARGADAGGPLRQLVRLGLVTLRKDAGGYATTPRFLELFGLAGLDDLPRPAA
jgi:chromosome segregation and condensation protein ScpB